MTRSDRDGSRTDRHRWGLLFLGVAVATLAAASSVLAQETSKDGPPSEHEQAVDLIMRVNCRRALEGSCPKRVLPSRVERGMIELDGQLHEQVWESAERLTDFLQREPTEGEAPSDLTEVAFAYDSEAFYVGARMYSSDPDRIRAVMARRDRGVNAERLLVFLDTYHDHRTAYGFGVTAAGGRLDWYHPVDSEDSRDQTFDAAWQARTVIDSLGWSAEIRIPFSELRFPGGGDRTWGLNVSRYIPTRQERVDWVLIPETESVWASRFGDLVGIQDLGSPIRLELIPYIAAVSTLTSSSLVVSEDPFSDSEETVGRGGADVEIGLGPNFTLAGTFNPDFAQVDADPAVVNLTAFEVFFEERRPFFTERSEFFTGAGPSYFYSRRIGAPPHGRAFADFSDVPRETTILGAGKLTGRAGGFSLGVLGAVTAEEHARTFDLESGTFGETPVEPLTAYAAGRLQQQFGGDGSTIGGTFTGVRRDLEDPVLASFLPGESYAGGVDWNLRFGGGAYALTGSIGLSHVAGDSNAVRRLQTSSRRYYQRPDADYVDVDPTLPSISGYQAALQFSKRSGDVLAGIGGSASSPGFEINDLGRMRKSDVGQLHGWLTVRETQPSGPFQNYSLSLGSNAAWNFGGVRTATGATADLTATFRNFWGTWLSGGGRARTLSDVLTRGGPLMATGAGAFVSGGFWSDQRSKTQFSLSGSYGWDELGGWDYWLTGDVSAQPGDHLQLSLAPRYSRVLDSRQYVATVEGGPPDTFGRRYVFAFTDLSTLSAQVRVNLAITPELTIEGYAEPFASSGRFFDHGQLTAARSRTMDTYGTGETTIEEVRNADGDVVQYRVTDGEDSFALPFSDFNVLSFRTNAVLRWEYVPGSTLFLVWQQNRFASEAQGDLVRPGDLADALEAPGWNVLALKVTYRLPIR